MKWNLFIFPQAFLKSFTWNNFFANFSRNANFDIFIQRLFVILELESQTFQSVQPFLRIYINSAKLISYLWHLKNCQKIGSVYFSNFQKIILFKRSVYRVRVSVGPCIFLIPKKIRQNDFDTWWLWSKILSNFVDGW